jgi:hypothetical protein
LKGVGLTTDDLLSVWHWEVHRQFQEDLYFFHFRVIPYITIKTTTEILEFLRKHQLSGYCCYEIIGGFDILMRVWLTQKLSSTFESHLRFEVPGVCNVLMHRVFEFPISWKWNAEKTDRQALLARLRKLTDKDVRQVQQNPASAAAEKLKSVGLFNTHSKRTDTIKFFVHISAPEIKTDRSHHMMVSTIKQCADKFQDEKRIDRYELCITLGTYWGIITAETNNYFEIGLFVSELISKLESFGSYTTTLLATGQFREEAGYISNDALIAAEGINVGVAHLMPQIYNDTVSETLRRDIETWVRMNILNGKLSERNEEILLSCLSGIAHENEKEIRTRLFEFLSDFEGYLHDHWGKYAASLELNHTEMLKNTHLNEKDEDDWTLDDLLVLYNTIHNRTSAKIDKDILRDYKRITDIRNCVAHNKRKFKPLETWKEDLTSIVDFMLKVQKLQLQVEVNIKRFDEVRTTSFK